MQMPLRFYLNDDTFIYLKEETIMKKVLILAVMVQLVLLITACGMVSTDDTQADNRVEISFTLSKELFTEKNDNEI
jgi:hypothetical protein